MFTQFIWAMDDDPEGNVQHIAAHGLTPDDVEHALENYYDMDTSRSSGEPIAFGPALDGSEILVVFEWVDRDAGVVYPITAYHI